MIDIMLKLLLIYVLPFWIFTFSVLFLLIDKSTLDSIIVIISLLALIINNLSDDFIKVKNTTDELAKKIYIHISKTLLISGVISIVLIIIAPVILDLLDDKTFVYKDYYCSYTFSINCLFYICVIILGFILPKVIQKYPHARNIPYTIFWILILLIYLLSLYILNHRVYLLPNQ